MRGQTLKFVLVWGAILGLLSLLEGTYFRNYVLPSVINACIFVLLLFWPKKA